jgi:hypothetical protein
MIAIAGFLAVAGGAAVVILAVYHPPDPSDLRDTAKGLQALFFLGTFISMWVANYLATVRPAR